MYFPICYNEEENINDNVFPLKPNSNYEIKKDYFNDALKATKSKFNAFCKMNFNNQNSNIIENIKNRRVHTQYIFNKKNLNKVDDIINDKTIVDELCKNISNKKYNKSISYIDNSKEETKDTDKQNWTNLDNKTDNKDYFDTKMNNYSIIDTKISNHDKIENIDECVKIRNNNNYNHDLFNQNTNINFLCKKRSKDCSDIKEDSYNLFEAIQNLYNKYNKEKKVQQNGEFIIYEEGIMKQIFTIILKEETTCIIYATKKVINEIYLVKEQIFVRNEDEIKDVLTKVFQNIKKLIL